MDAPRNGYQSDYDLLVIVSHAALTDIADYWYVAEDRMLRDLATSRQVNIIVHTLEEVNRGLTRGEYFWVDIVRDGVALYEGPGAELTSPQPLTAADAYEMASGYFADKFGDIEVWLETAATQQARLDDAVRYRRHAAFNLHQAAETAYICFLLVRTLYVPRSHNLKFLRSLAEDKEPALIDCWPRGTKLDRRRFELAKRAYVEARYPSSYEIGIEDLQAICSSVCALRDTVNSRAHAWIEGLRKTAGL